MTDRIEMETATRRLAHALDALEEAVERRLEDDRGSRLSDQLHALGADRSKLAAELDGDALKGEVVIVVGPPLPPEISDEDIVGRLIPALGDMSLRDAAKLIADMLGVPKSRVYDLGIKLRKEL